MDDLFENCCPRCKRPYAEQTAPGFADFWASVPYKIGKADAEKAWRKLGQADRASAAARVVGFYDWFTKTHPTASPLHPSTYLNGKRWMDEHGTTTREATQSERDGIKQAMQSRIPSVREHAQRMAKRAGMET